MMRVISRQGKQKGLWKTWSRFKEKIQQLFKESFRFKGFKAGLQHTAGRALLFALCCTNLFHTTDF